MYTINLFNLSNTLNLSSSIYVCNKRLVTSPVRFRIDCKFYYYNHDSRVSLQCKRSFRKLRVMHIIRSERVPAASVRILSSAGTFCIVSRLIIGNFI